MATIEAAGVLSMASHIGSTTVGKRADIALVRKDGFGGATGHACNYLLLQASARDIDTVLVDGVGRVQAGRVVATMRRRRVALAGEARQRIFEAIEGRGTGVR
jgi:cytosine/adenosine deaminase-related metal-dependent hydrolase